MIRYALRCTEDHAFEAWFRSSADYDRTAGKGAVTCPICGDTRVEKALMAPAVVGTRKRAPIAAATDAEPARDTKPAGNDKVQLAAADPRREELKKALKELRQKVTENADYVGNRFAEEARKIHYKETEPRGIYGEASREEAKALAEEGVEFHPLPLLPEDRN